MLLYSFASRAALLALIIFFSTPALAQDIFIRPNSGTTAPAVDLGVKSRPKQPPKPAAPGPTAPAPIPVQPAPPPPPQQPAPVAPITPAPMPAPAPTSGDSTIYQIPEDPPPDPGKGPNGIGIGFQPGVLGPSDTAILQQSLNLSGAEIQRGCSFRYSTLLSYGQQDESAYISTGGAPTMQYRYTGPLMSVQIFPVMACQKLRRPLSNTVLEQGSYYIVSLSTVDCPPGPKGAAPSVSLAFRYVGDGKGECRYQ